MTSGASEDRDNRREARPPGEASTGRNRPGHTTGRREEENARTTALQVASLNINGFGNLIHDHPDNKWGRVYRMMSEHRIGVLLMQETHLTEERKAGLHKMFARKIKIFHTAHPEAPTQKEGVAVVLNCRYVNTTDATATIIIPGRAIQISLTCQGGDRRTILCVYAPTSSGVDERKQFFEAVREFYISHPDCARPHLMAGDFNNVEDTIDRLPINEGPDQSVTALDELKLYLGLMLADGWRATYPNTREYTFHRGSDSNAVFSRLDRIYVSPVVFDGAREWRICEAGVKTDHSLISVQLTAENAPTVGPGRPLFPIALLKDKKLTRAIKERGLMAMQELERLNTEGVRSDSANPQLILHKFKTDMMKLARAREREVVPKLLAEIREGEKTLRQLKANRLIPEQTVLTEAAKLTKQIRELKLRRFKQQQQNSRATHRLYGDRPTKYWSKMHRECAPQDVISAFEKEGVTGVSGEKIYETDSARMADMARTHHMNVQKDALGQKAPTERESDIATALDSIEVEVSNDQATDLGSEITYDECVLSLRFAKNGTAPGLDGIPFETWKALHARHIKDSRFRERTDFDVMKLITAAFEDMRTRGVSRKTSLAHGWMAPIYKEKGERTRVVNYRPITLLNTDYKLLSKALAVRLADVAPGLIHRAQAGFVPGRKIHNHTQLARLMMTWAESKQANGAIVALDQEKAYDKIAHDYLWRVLHKFRIPMSLIRLIQSLYANAETSVMVNGILSRSYRIYRGVRQGDPLSCLLFDLAIEPLSAMIRKSDIEGFNIPRCEEVLKAVLFADDTTVYLSSRDDFSVLQGVLDTWCSAAKARFNIGKTEIIPIGDPAFRAEMAETYRRTGAWKNYPRGVHVAQEGEAVRILGAFFGNGVKQIDVWTLVLTKIVAMRKPLMHVIARWKNGHATLQGKKHVVQMIVGGMTQFLTNVQRMPETIRQRLTKLMREYIWDGQNSSPVSMDYLYLPVAMGGLGMLDLETRSEAIDVMWLKAYLDFSDERPIWAFLADDLLASHVPKECRPREDELRVNPFLQQWKPKVRGLPDELDGLMKVARKYGLRLEGLAFSKSIQRAMPMWDHAHADKARLGRLSIPSKLLSCIQVEHKLRTVGDFANLANLLEGPRHKPRARCPCTDCDRIRSETNCANPHACGKRAKEMIDALPSKWDPRTRQPEDYEDETMECLRREELESELVPFDRRVTTRGDLGKAFRIFTGDIPVSNDTIPMETHEDGTELSIATDGSCTSNGERNARAGAGIYVEAGHHLNRSFRLPCWLGQSNQSGEIVATLLATTAADKHTRVTQITDSQTTMDSLSKWRQKHEDTGYILQRNGALTRTTIARLRMRSAHTLFKWVRGHDGHPGNEAADELAARGREKVTGEYLDITVPAQYRVTGAKLQAMTQKLVYRAIRARKDLKEKPRPRAVANLDRITSGLQAAFGIQVFETSVWTSLRSKHVSRQAAQFLWMAVHDGFMLGSHWLRPNMSEELQQRAICAACNEQDSMSHVLFECNAGGQELIWSRLKDTWTHTGEEWKEPNWGTTIGAACAVFLTKDGARKPATENLWCILCTEATYLIWKLRCERVIQNEGADFSDNEIINRYYSTLESRLNLDRRTAAITRGGRNALKPQEVEAIWTPILDDRDNLPAKWVTNNGVLVGIKRGK